MALDCVTQVPEEFFNRNDKFGMAYGMEGRFPLATKMFMQYCLNIPSTLKVNQNIEGTKQFVKAILNDPDTYFTEDNMKQLDEAAEKEFKYGQAENEC